MTDLLRPTRGISLKLIVSVCALVASLLCASVVRSDPATDSTLPNQTLPLPSSVGMGTPRPATNITVADVPNDDETCCVDTETCGESDPFCLNIQTDTFVYFPEDFFVPRFNPERDPITSHLPHRLKQFPVHAVCSSGAVPCYSRRAFRRD